MGAYTTTKRETNEASRFCEKELKELRNKNRYVNL